MNQLFEAYKKRKEEFEKSLYEIKDLVKIIKYEKSNKFKKKEKQSATN